MGVYLRLFKEGSMEKSIGFIGGGRITKIFLQAFHNRNLSLKDVAVCDIDNDTSEKLKQKFPDISIADLESVSSKEIVFIALHPPAIMEVLASMKGFVSGSSVVISLAPKITLDAISANLGNKNIVRMIPNAASIINKGYNPVCFACDCAGKEDMMELFSVLGKTFETDEPKLEAYAIVSAMLPTYFWFQWLEIADIAKQIGLSEAEAGETVENTLLSSVETLFKSGLRPLEVLDLIPVKPIGDSEGRIKEILKTKLFGLYGKIKP